MENRKSSIINRQLHNPYNYHIAVRDDALFFGQEVLLDRLVSGLSAPTPISAALFGGRRCGKTSLLSKLARSLSGMQAAGGRCILPCSLDLQRGRPLTCSDDFFLWVLEELGELWEIQRGHTRGSVVDVLQTAYRDVVRRGPVEAFVQAFRALDTQGERLRLVILLDESEQILTVEWCEDLRPNLRALLSNSPIVEDVALVMAGSTQMYVKVTERDSPLENILDRHLLTPLSHEATLALARHPNQERLSEPIAEVVWEQSGGQPCLTQFILHELWEESDGALENVTPEDVIAAVETFESLTHHFSTWTHALGARGAEMYAFLSKQSVPVTYTMLRQQFASWPNDGFQATVDALLYHGMIRCEGRGRRQQYTVAGHAYREWFLTAGRLREPASVRMARSLPPDLYQRVQEALLACGPFADGAALRAFFVNTLLAPWRDMLPEAQNSQERVRAVIDVLSQRDYAETGENGLALLLRVLSDNTPAADACHARLASLADEVTHALHTSISTD